MTAASFSAAVLALASVIVTPGSAAERLRMLACCVVFVFFQALAGLALGLKLANLTWTNENIPVKQSISVFLILLIGWVFALALGGLYFWIGWKIGAAAYLSVFTAATAVGSLVLYLWLRKRGTIVFEKL